LKTFLGASSASLVGYFLYQKQTSNAAPSIIEKQIPHNSAFLETPYQSQNPDIKVDIGPAALLPAGNKFKAAVTQIPYYKKRERGGEDAFVISEEILTVADGVGGWNRKGVDPGIFARELSLRVWSAYLNRRDLLAKG
jgi:hypothetical protein